MRILIAALFGGIVLFVWGFVAHTILPLGEMGMQQPVGEDAVLESIKSGLPVAGIYMLPSLEPEKWGDEAAMKTWSEKAKINPYAYIVVAPSAADPAAMGPQLVKQFICDFLGSLIVAWLLAAMVWDFGARVICATAMGVFAWIAAIVPMWTWYRFPTDFMVAGLIEQGVGWMLGGVAISWWLGRKKVTQI